MKKRVLFLLVVALLLFNIPGCGTTTASGPPADGKIAVVATIYPLYDFARQVGGDRVEVTRLLPAGAEPHTWEPTPRDMAALTRAKVFIYNGAGMEPWVQRQLGMLEEKGVKVVEASRGVDLITGSPEHRHEHNEGKAREEIAGVDPHVWLDPVLAQEMVKNIRDAFMAVDPDHASYYKSRAEEYIAELRDLDREYRQAAQSFKRQEIVTSHAAFGYLARRYGLRQVPVMGLSPESEPDPAHMREIVAFCRKHNVKYIFFETLVSPKISQALAREVGAQTLVLNPGGNITPEEESRGENYLSIMRQNLVNLKIALGEKS
ncbi:metal ABC transporter substrate-binding protein [Desulfofundulus thermosubterraneus]|uniref:Zinc transport system substrate-binding protein n=1 Tax=Desulfofundulus thermosubterraneus DSM 16057 TaxID=1121432 RepID=A0A1M6HM04_9FIRM|nr:metal ABC transporter substrate-binding protein [Desulfofundulus thermosubterraneus]SHJ23212.1 zinc transport system substrate-binding protein [Desulfofundulus thermosubterraneus DSM 16057]